MNIKIFFFALLILLSNFSNANEEKINKVKEYVIENTDNKETGEELYGYIKFYSKEYEVEEENSKEKALNSTFRELAEYIKEINKIFGK